MKAALECKYHSSREKAMKDFVLTVRKAGVELNSLKGWFSADDYAELELINTTLINQLQLQASSSTALAGN